MGRSENGLDDWLGEPDAPQPGSEAGQQRRAYGLPGGGLTMILILIGGLLWIAHSPPNHSAVKSNRGAFHRQSSTPATLAFAPGGRVLATGHHDGLLKILDLERDAKHPLEIVADQGKTILAVAFSPDGKTLVTGGEAPTLKLWDVGTGKLRATFDGRGSPVRGLAFSPDGKTIAWFALDGVVKLQDVKTGREVSRLSGHLGDIRGLAFSPDGATLAVGALQGDVRIWDVASGRERDVLRYQDRLVNSLAFAPDGKRLAIALCATNKAQKHEIAIWSVAEGHEAIQIFAQAHNAKVAFSPDGKTLAASCYDIVKLWDIESGREFANLEGHVGYISSLSFSPDGRLLATASLDMLIGLFSIEPEESKSGRL
jgi:WD40 repeat protein